MGLLKKGSKAYSMVNMKCPRCQEGDLFDTGSFSFKKSFDMKHHCPVCGQRYNPEPGFYYGAMFISYILYGWFSLFLVGFCMLVLGMGVNPSLGVLIVVSAILFVWVFRISRSIWLSFNVKYQPQAKERYTQQT